MNPVLGPVNSNTCYTYSLKSGIEHISSVSLTVIIIVIFAPSYKCTVCTCVAGCDILTLCSSRISKFSISGPCVSSVRSCMIPVKCYLCCSLHSHFFELIIIYQLTKSGSLYLFCIAAVPIPCIGPCTECINAVQHGPCLGLVKYRFDDHIRRLNTCPRRNKYHK